MMNYDSEHLEEKRNRRQIPSEDPNSVDVDLSCISPIFHKETTKFSQLPTLPPSLFDFSLSPQLASSPLPDFDCYQPIILRPPAPLSLQLVIAGYCFSREVVDDIKVLSAFSSLLLFPYETIPPPQISKSDDQQVHTCTLLLVRGEGIDSLLLRMNRFKIGDLLRTSKKDEVLTLLKGNPDLFLEDPLSQFFSLPTFSPVILMFFVFLSNAHSDINGAVESYSYSNPVIVTHIHSHTLSKLPTFRSVLAAISHEGIRISGVRTTFLIDDDITKISHILPVNMHRLSSRVSYDEDREGFEGAHRVVMLALQGKDVIKRWGDILGSENLDDAKRAAPTSFRANHGMTKWKNVASSPPYSIH